MSYAGHVLDMMKRMKANRAMQKKRRSAFQERANKLAKDGSSYEEGTEVLNEISEAEKKLIRERLALQLAKDRKKALIVNSVLMLILLFFSYQFYIWFFA